MNNEYGPRKGGRPIQDIGTFQYSIYYKSIVSRGSKVVVVSFLTGNNGHLAVHSFLSNPGTCVVQTKRGPRGPPLIINY
jgi:hypothetical protein